MFRLASSYKGLDLEFICEESVPDEVVTDGQRIKQVLLNLLQNALKFTARGSITVRASYDRTTKYLSFSVTDTGLGISESDQKKLFSLFGKLNSNAAVNTNGIGLGLNTCKKICEVF